MADASDSPSSSHSSSKRRAPKESAQQQETPRKRIRPTEGQQVSNRSSLPPPGTFPEGVIDLTASDDEDVVMESSREESPAASLPYDTCFGLVRYSPSKDSSCGCYYRSITDNDWCSSKSPQRYLHQKLRPFTFR